MDSEMDNFLVNNVGINTTVPVFPWMVWQTVGNFYIIQCGETCSGPRKYFGANQHGSINIKL